MKVEYHKRHCGQLGRDMEFKTYGHAGRPVVVFPTSRGRFYQFEDTGSIGVLAPFIDAGRIKVWTVDGIDDETFFSKNWDVQARMARHDAYFDYIRDDILPDARRETADANGGHLLKPLLSGCSMGAYHASNFLFRNPDLTAGVIALSGVYSTRDFAGDNLEGRLYFNSPLDYLSGVSDEKTLAKLRSQRLFFCTGQGAWEERMIVETRRLQEVLREKNIPAWVDFWGTDVSHDWPWWHKQLTYFFDLWLDADTRRKLA